MAADRHPGCTDRNLTRIMRYLDCPMYRLFPGMGHGWMRVVENIQGQCFGKIIKPMQKNTINGFINKGARFATLFLAILLYLFHMFCNFAKTLAWMFSTMRVRDLAEASRAKDKYPVPERLLMEAAARQQDRVQTTVKHGFTWLRDMARTDEWGDCPPWPTSTLKMIIL